MMLSLDIAADMISYEMVFDLKMVLSTLVSRQKNYKKHSWIMGKNMKCKEMSC